MWGTRIWKQRRKRSLKAFFNDEKKRIKIFKSNIPRIIMWKECHIQKCMHTGKEKVSGEYATLQILCSEILLGKVSIKQNVLYAKIRNNFLVNFMVIALQSFVGWILF